jgi:hypothetical protein
VAMLYCVGLMRSCSMALRLLEVKAIFYCQLVVGLELY